MNNQIQIYNNIDFYNDIIIKQGWNGYIKICGYILQNFDNKISIADIGCGTGETGKLLSLAGYKSVDGYDITPKMVKQSSNYYNKSILLDIESTPLPKTYDVILASGLYDYAGLDASSAENLNKSLKINGVVIMTNPDTNYFETHGWKDNKYFYNLYTSKSFCGRTTEEREYYYKIRVMKKVNDL